MHVLITVTIALQYVHVFSQLRRGFRTIVLHYLCTPPHAHALVQVLKKLLFEIENHNALDSNGDAPLHSYVRRRDKESFDCLVTFLTYSKCDINYHNIEGQTALHLACKVSYQPFLSFYVIYLEYNHSNLRFFEVKLVCKIWSLQ